MQPNQSQKHLHALQVNFPRLGSAWLIPYLTFLDVALFLAPDQHLVSSRMCHFLSTHQHV